MYTMIVGMPILGGIISGLFGRKIGEKGVVIVNTSMIGVAGVMSIIAYKEVGIEGNRVIVSIGRWIESGMLEVNWSMKYDSVTIVMLLLVTIVSTMVHIYSSEYMEGDAHKVRFFTYITLFTAGMLVLIVAENYLVMFTGYELIGICSYLLINYWFTRIEANKAAIEAMLVNRVGDLGLAIGIIWLYIKYRTMSYEEIFNICGKEGREEIEEIKYIGTCLLIGAVGKSAQVGLHTWLPNAMEGPTSVSALIHAATLVTAGVYLIARSSPLIENSKELMEIITIVGGITAIYAATIGIVQNDMKKIIAYSTCSQIGYMVFACGLSSYSVGMFHVLNHGFFKALLFLSAGSVIHGISDEQDIRRIGGLRKIMPYTYSMLMIGSMALIGFPFLTGYYSKDVILEMAYMKSQKEMKGIFVYVVGVIGAFCTAYYSMRLLNLVFLSKASSNRIVVEESHESGWRIKIPLLILSIGSIFVGYMMKESLIGVGTDFWNGGLYVHPMNSEQIDAEYMSKFMKWFPVIISMMGVGLAWIMYTYEEEKLFEMKKSGIGRRLYIFINRKWFYDKVYVDVISQGILEIGYKITYKGIDKGILERIGPKGINEKVEEGSKWIGTQQNGNIYNYIMVMFIGIGVVTLSIIL